MSWLEKKKDYTYLEVKAYGVNSIYYVVFLAFSVLGTAFYGYFFAFHLLHIAVLNQLLKRVIQAVTTNGTSLLLVGMLGMVIIFIYALLSFAVLRERFLEASKGRDCTTVYECFITVLHHGFVDSLYTKQRETEVLNGASCSMKNDDMIRYANKIDEESARKEAIISSLKEEKEKSSADGRRQQQE
ncbi:unnamed protein product [Mytilus edulis]|uniref:Uncharacterized protein n=1 Tax=Mytilus edulis TaxID=6550 RepID=A0A8S3QPJ5_MYTED|nr:unnamed protein product [Mytilus edulis]